MKRLHIGDVVKAHYPYSKENHIGIIDQISMFNDESIDNCEYSIAMEITDLEIIRAKNQQIPLPHPVIIQSGCAWFRRQDIELLEESPLRKYQSHKGDLL